MPQRREDMEHDTEHGTGMPPAGSEEQAEVEEIKRLEREIFQRSSALAAKRVLAQHGVRKEWLVVPGLSQDELARRLANLVRAIGETSIGGNSVEDIRRGRGS